MIRDTPEATGPPATVEDIVERLLQVPDRYRDFYLTLEHVTEHYEIQGPLLEQLLDLGMPHRGAGANRMFNGVDLENIGNALGLPTLGWRTMRMLAITFGGIKNPDQAVFRVRSASKCPHPKHESGCDVRPSTLLAAAGGYGIECDPSGVTAQVHLAVYNGPAIGHLIAPLVQLAGDLTFHYLPAELASDIGFAAETGLADCRLASHLLAANSAIIDLPVRIARGLIMGVPFLLAHEWVEVKVGRKWVSIDPFFLDALARWRIIDSQSWPSDKPVGEVYWPFHETDSVSDISLVTDHGRNSQGSARILNWRDVFVHG